MMGVCVWNDNVIDSNSEENTRNVVMKGYWIWKMWEVYYPQVYLTERPADEMDYYMVKIAFKDIKVRKQ